MTTSPESKVAARHLARTAYLYVRQSSLRQVLEHTENTARQYALRQRAVALGWPADQVVVSDCDQGLSGASAIDCAGFQNLVAEVGLGHAGIVLGLEVSRLARSSADWHCLLELCALSGTLILDEDGLYDPSQYNDRLLLGLKDTISETELHVLRARLIGGVLNKARRAELKVRLRVGLAYDPLDRVVLDPDQQVQHAVRLLFSTFRRTGSPWRRCAPSRRRICCFRAACGPARAGASCCGSHCCAATCWIRCTIRATPVLSSGERMTLRYHHLPRVIWHIGWTRWTYSCLQAYSGVRRFPHTRPQMTSPCRSAGPSQMDLMPASASCSSTLSLRSRWKRRWQFSRRWKRVRLRRTVSGDSTSNVRATKPRLRSIVFYASIRIIVWSPTRSRLSGTPDYVSWLRHKRRTSTSALTPNKRSTTNSALPFWTWPPTCLGCGEIPAHRPRTQAAGTAPPRRRHAAQDRSRHGARAFQRRRHTHTPFAATRADWSAPQDRSDTRRAGCSHRWRRRLRPLARARSATRLQTQESL
jgi:DNA invertase Pin-like site-specific DNA recombinase